MQGDVRRPLAESREPRSIRFTPTEWRAFTVAAIARGLEVSAFVRECAIAGRHFIEADEAMRALKRASS